MHPQIPLKLDPGRTLTFSVFWAGENALLLDVLQRFAVAQSQDMQIFISGRPGSGKTHLLSATCQLATEQGYRIAYLPAQMIGHGDSLAGYEACDLVCIDDLQLLPSGNASEQALFALINSMRNRGGRLLISAECTVAELAIELPDLKTRLGWGASYALSEVAPDQLAQVLAMRAEYLGMGMSAELIEFMLARYPRDLASQLDLLDTLQQASLQAKRRLTVPFARAILSAPDLS